MGFSMPPCAAAALDLGIIDRRFGQLGDPINGCHCIQAWRTAGGQLAAGLGLDLRRRAIGAALVGCGAPIRGVVAERLGDGADRLGELTRDDPEGVAAFARSGSVSRYL